MTVIPLQKGIPKESLTYFSAQDIPNGSLVSILVRRKKILGLVIFSEEAVNVKSDIKRLDFDLKKIIEVKGLSAFRKEYLEAANLASQYFASNRGSLLASIIPQAFRENYNELIKIKEESKKETFTPDNSNQNNLKPEKLLFQAPLNDRISYYKTLVRESFAQKKSIFIILPGEREIDSFWGYLAKGIEQFIIPIHGGMSAKSQMKRLEQIISLEHPVLVLGTTPHLAIPRNDFSTIILEHEGSGAYRTISRPYLDLRIFAEIFASKIGAKFVLSDNLLQFETLARQEIDGFGEVQPVSYKIKNSGIIKILQRERGKFQIILKESLREIKRILGENKKVFIFSVRKGLTSLTLCRDCGESLICEQCSSPLVLYFSRNRQKRILACNRCGSLKDPETVCLNCQSWNLISLGIGTDSIMQEMEKKFSKAKILKLDKESAQTAKGAEKIVEQFFAEGESASSREKKGGILIGTEMAFPYLKEKVDLSVVASLDSLWSIPNFRMSEKILNLLLAILVRTKENLIVQSKNEKDPILTAIQKNNLASFVREELADRRKLGYPPYQRFIKITYCGDKEKTLNARKTLAEVFREYRPEIFSGFIAKRKNKYLTNALLRLETKNWSLPELSADSQIDKNLLRKLLALPPEFSVSVNPEDLL